MRFLTAVLGLSACAALAQGAPSSPCLEKTEWQQLDFWLGDWEVRAQGKAIARSRIEKSTDGCVVHEHYVQGDYSGKSINFFDPVLRHWRQAWVDNSGNVSEFSGEYREGAMRFEGVTHRSTGQRVLRRMTLFNLEHGEVRQFSEQSLDDGKSWSVGYDFQYLRAR